MPVFCSRGFSLSHVLGKNENSSGGEAGVGTMSQGGWVSERVGEPGKGLEGLRADSCVWSLAGK